MGYVNLEKERVGIIGKNNYGSLMEVVKYNSNRDIWVKFEKGKPVHAQWCDFMKGRIRNVYDKSVYGIGYIGEGEYKPSVNGKNTKQNTNWYDMIRRCYDEKCQEKHPGYKECSVTDEWHNYQNFAKWFDENYYEIEGQRMDLDKDILKKGNKIYSPDTCVFVPQRINVLFVKHDSRRGDHPIGVNFDKNFEKYVAHCSNAKGRRNQYW